MVKCTDCSEKQACSVTFTWTNQDNAVCTAAEKGNLVFTAKINNPRDVNDDKELTIVGYDETYKTTKVNCSLHGKLGHQRASTPYSTTAANCTTASTEKYKCVRFGKSGCIQQDSKDGNVEYTTHNTKALDHNWTPATKTLNNGVVIGMEPTCEVDGTYYQTCSRAGCTVKATAGHTNVVSGTKLGHEKSSKKYDKGCVAATCTAKSTESYYCIRYGSGGCTKIYSEDHATAALGHDFTSTTKTDTYRKNKADCTNPERYWYKCKRCDVSSKDQTKGTNAGKTFNGEDAKGHSYTKNSDVSWSDFNYICTNSSASCTVKCAVCETKASPINVKNTTFTKDTKKDATCKTAETFNVTFTATIKDPRTKNDIKYTTTKTGVTCKTHGIKEHEYAWAEVKKSSGTTENGKWREDSTWNANLKALKKTFRDSVISNANNFASTYPNMGINAVEIEKELADSKWTENPAIGSNKGTVSDGTTSKTYYLTADGNAYVATIKSNDKYKSNGLTFKYSCNIVRNVWTNQKKFSDDNGGHISSWQIAICGRKCKNCYYQEWNGKTGTATTNAK